MVKFVHQERIVDINMGRMFLRREVVRRSAFVEDNIRIPLYASVVFVWADDADIDYLFGLVIVDFEG